MDEMKVEWVHPSFLITREQADEKMTMIQASGNNLKPPIPVVRLDAVDQVLGDLVWALEIIRDHHRPYQGTDTYKKTYSILATVVAFRARQEGK